MLEVCGSNPDGHGIRFAFLLFGGFLLFLSLFARLLL
jgi:hypothetical protein